MSRFLSLLVFFASVHAAAGLTLSLDEAPARAVQQNAGLAAARLRIAEARGRLLGAGRLANPEVEFEGSHNTRSPERAGGITLVQRFPLTARLRLEKAVSTAQLAAAEAEVREVERRLVGDVRAAAIKLVALRLHRALRAEQIANSREQAESARRRVATAEASTLDATQLELEVRQLQVELTQLDAARAGLEGELRGLLAVAASERLEITGTLSPPERAPAAFSNSGQRPDVAAARSNAEAALLGTELARARRWEDVGFGLTARAERTEDAPNGLSNDYLLGFKFSIPLPIWNQGEGRVAEATASATRARLEVAALTEQARNEAATAQAEMQAHRRVLAEFEGAVLPQAAEVETQLRNAYAAGQSPLGDALRARARRLELAQRHIDALRDYHLARARYLTALGREILPRRRR